jgi:hypothetical protein
MRLNLKKNIWWGIGCKGGERGKNKIKDHASNFLIRRESRIVLKLMERRKKISNMESLEGVKGG